MSMPQLTAGVAAGLAAAGRDRLDLIVFDACIMASYSVVQALAPLARFVAAAETNEYGGYQYQALLATLSANPTMTPFELGSAFVDLFHLRSQEDGFPTVLPVTYTLVDSDALTAGLTPAMASLTTALHSSLAAHAAGECSVALRVALDRKRFGGAAAVPVNTKYQLVDLGDWLRGLSALPDGPHAVQLRTLATQADAAYRRTVVRFVNNPVTRVRCLTPPPFRRCASLAHHFFRPRPTAEPAAKHGSLHRGVNRSNQSVHNTPRACVLPPSQLSHRPIRDEFISDGWIASHAQELTGLSVYLPAHAAATVVATPPPPPVPPLADTDWVTEETAAPEQDTNALTFAAIAQSVPAVATWQEQLLTPLSTLPALQWDSCTAVTETFQWTLFRLPTDIAAVSTLT
jgi:hypothetical protein